MHTSKLLIGLVTGLVTAALLAAWTPARAQERSASESSAGKSAATAKKAQDAQVVELTVTKDGFVPPTVTVKHGKPVKLVVTRKVERTCATEIVSKDLNVHAALPLEKPVTVKVTPKKPGDYRFGCAMDMIAGTLRVE
jgi:plastocyanin domain-containing protein